MFNAITMYLNKLDILYQKALKYQHHAENYKESLELDITPFGWQLKKKAAISAISPDFNNQWNNVLKDAEKKLSKLLLKEVREISNEGNKKFDKQVKVSYPHSLSERKKHVQQRNLKYKKSLEERRRKWLKC